MFISHSKDKTFKRKDGTEYNQTVPTCPNSYNDIAKNMADIYAYAEKYEESGTAKVRLILRSPDNSAETGSRFKYIAPVIPFEYDELVKALNAAIDKEAEATGNKFVTDNREVVSVTSTYDFDEVSATFEKIAGDLMNENAEYYRPRITAIIDKYLGKGKKVAEATPNQAELIALINQDITEDLINKK